MNRRNLATTTHAAAKSKGVMIKDQQIRRIQINTPTGQAFFEDVDLCYSLREQGGRIIYFPSVIFLHHEDLTTLKSGLLNSRYWFIKNSRRFKEKWRHRFEKEEGPSKRDLKWIRKQDLLSMENN